MRFHFLAALAACTYAAPAVATPPVTATATIRNTEIWFDGYRFTDGPAVYGEVSVGDSFSVDLMAQEDLRGDTGDYVGLGVSWRKDLGSDVNLELWGVRWLYKAFEDLTEVGGSISKGPWKVSFDYSQWDREPDGVWLGLEYALPVGEKVTISPSLNYVDGFGARPYVSGGLAGKVMLTDKLSVVTNVVVPLHEAGESTRKVQVSFGLSFSF